MRQLDTALKNQLVATLTPLFGKEPNFISDSSAQVEWLKSSGFHAFDFKEIHSRPMEDLKCIVVLGTNNATIPHHKVWDALFQDSRLLLIPLVSFDPSIETAAYNLELLAQSSFETATRLNERWVQTLLKHKEPFIFSGEECDLVCKIEEDVHIMLPKTAVELMPGEWVSIGSYFEVGMIAQPDDLRPAFSVSGTLNVPGVAVAHHRQMHDNLLPLTNQAWALFEELHSQGAFPLQLRLENSRVTHIFAGEKDIAKELEYLTNKKHERVLTEMAFSTNQGVVSQNIDWSKNSQLNEGAIGIHVALGDGLTGAHVDFICPGVKLQN